MSQKRFVPTDVDFNGSLIGYVTCSYDDLVEVFGEPNSTGDGYKTSTAWFVKDTKTGETCEIYDWKETVLYDETLMSVEKFRSLPSYRWHIGGTSFDVDALIEFLDEELGPDDKGCENW